MRISTSKWSKDLNSEYKSNWNNLISVLCKTKFNVKKFLKKFKASQKSKNSERCLLIIIFKQHLDRSCSHHKQYAFGLVVFNAYGVEQNQCKMFTKKKVVKNITFPTVFCTYYLVATVFGSNFLNQKDIYRSTCQFLRVTLESTYRYAAKI